MPLYMYLSIVKSCTNATLKYHSKILVQQCKVQTVIKAFPNNSNSNTIILVIESS